MRAEGKYQKKRQNKEILNKKNSKKNFKIF